MSMAHLGEELQRLATRLDSKKDISIRTMTYGEEEVSSSWLFSSLVSRAERLVLNVSAQEETYWPGNVAF